MKTTAYYFFAICAALAAPSSFAAEPAQSCGAVRAVSASQHKGASYRVSVNIFDQKSKALKTTFNAIVDDGGEVAPVQVANEISRASAEPVVVGTFASLQAVPKGSGHLLRVCTRFVRLADQQPTAQLKVDESNSVLEVPLVVGAESRTVIGADEMVVKVATIER